MAEYLDSIDWASLQHAYGEASDVPDDLRDLVSPDKETRDDAYYRLYGNIFHQATRYEATAYAVPYLLKILENPSTPDRATVISYLVDLALGIPSLSLPGGANPAEYRERTRRLHTPEYEVEYYAEMDELVNQARNESLRKMHEYDRSVGLKRNREESKHELAAYDAVSAGVPVFQQCLEEDDPEVRTWAAFALAWFPGEEASGRNYSSAVALQRLLGQEQESIVLASAIIALGLLIGCWKDADATDGFDNCVPSLREYATDQRPLVRFAAAVALIRLQHHIPENVSILARVLTDRSFIPAADSRYSHNLPFPFCEGDPFKYSGKILITLDMDDYPDVLPMAVDALPRSEKIEALELTRIVMELAFGPCPDDDDTWLFASLNEIQQHIVTVLAEMADEYWEWGTLGEILEEWNIPGESRDECRQYVGLKAGTGNDEC
ncbi:hypothetical protein MW887_003050 [Aspergillus wentii]|nr:hypothetical protein MW887_003050 [Aspergillus wentii]